MECFIKKVFYGKIDEQVHRQFIRFSRGTFAGRAALNLQKKDKIKLRGSFEYSNDFVNLVSELQEAKFSGIILSKEEISGLSGRMKNGLFHYEVENLNSEKIKEIEDKTYAMLLDGESEGIGLEIKKKIPKPGKAGGLKIDDKFCQLDADLKYWQEIKEAFMLPDCGKAKISHTYIIEEVILPQGEKDFIKMREKARKKGRIIRMIEINGKERKEEKNFEA